MHNSSGLAIWICQSKGRSSQLNRQEKKLYAEVTKNCGKNISIHEILKKEKEICASSAVVPQTAKVTVTTLARWLSWSACCPVYQKVVGSIPGQGTYLGVGLITGRGMYRRRQPMDVSLSH